MVETTVFAKLQSFRRRRCGVKTMLEEYSSANRASKWKLSIFQGDMMQVSRVGVVVVRNVEEAVSASGLQVKRPRAERVVM